MLRHFSVDASDPLHLAVQVDGISLPPLARVTVDWREDSPPNLYLEAQGSGKITGEGVITQVIHEPTDQREAVAAWLANLDPAELEQAMLARGGGFAAAETTGEACLNTLREWAQSDG